MNDLSEHDGLGWALLEAAPDATVIVDRQGIICFANRRTREVFGYEPDDLVGRSVEVLIPDRMARNHVNWRTEYVAHPRARPMGADLELAARRKDGSEFPVDVSLSPLTTEDDLLVLAAVRDVTDRKRFEQELARQALHDPLTGLPNRQLLVDRLDVALVRQVRDGGDTGVLYADLDHFKWVNDSLGHDRGDTLLVQVADRLTDAVRGTDTVSRFGGDEFVIVLDAISGQQEAEHVAQRCAEAVAVPMFLDDTEIHQMVSIGVTTCSSGQQCNANTLIRQADQAMYRAKEHGRAHYEVYSETVGKKIVDPLEEEIRLRRAIADGEIILYYQPEIDLCSYNVVALEALARWQDPRRGLLMPDQFIPLAEETGLILPLGSMLLKAACRLERTSTADSVGPSIAINLSARQLLSRGLPDDISASLMTASLAASALVVEITETVVLHDLAASATALEALKDLGVRIAIDDFGTGYSSLTYLKGLPVDEVKVDRTFVEGLARDPRDRAIVAATIDMAHAFGLTITAEGVEDASQLRILQDLGAERAQGFFWTKPLPPGELTDWMTNQPVSPA